MENVFIGELVRLFGEFPENPVNAPPSRSPHSGTRPRALTATARRTSHDDVPLARAWANRAWHAHPSSCTLGTAAGRGRRESADPSRTARLGRRAAPARCDRGDCTSRTRPSHRGKAMQAWAGSARRRASDHVALAQCLRDSHMRHEESRHRDLGEKSPRSVALKI